MADKGKASVSMYLGGGIWSRVNDVIEWGSWAINRYRQEMRKCQLGQVMEVLDGISKSLNFPY